MYICSQVCAQRGLSSYVSMLLSGGADPNKTTITESTPAVILAAGGGRCDVIQVMLEHNIINEISDTPFPKNQSQPKDTVKRDPVDCWECGTTIQHSRNLKNHSKVFN